MAPLLNRPGGSSQPVTLDNCDREPIHVPSAIQPHGALLAFDGARRLVHGSDNVGHWLGARPLLGQPIDAQPLPEVDRLRAAVAELQAEGPQAAPQAIEPLPGPHGALDVLLHRAGELTVVEFESRAAADDQAPTFAMKAHRAMDRLKRQRSIQGLLDVAVETVRELTGFDRVMGYCFRHDDSGEVLAEAKRDDLEPYLGQRYPATDIPAQARRLYLLNTLRFIVDVDYAPVAVRAADDARAPLDMSHGVLRSVSPVHLEYLRNMGVAASMSVSIVVAGRLWGMLACHHLRPRHVPHSVRMACDVLAQLLAANVQTLLAGEQAKRLARAAANRVAAVDNLLQADDVVAGLLPSVPELQADLAADAVAVSLMGKLSCHGGIGEPAAATLVDWLQSQHEDMVAWHRRDQLPPAVGDALGLFCGGLALCFDRPAGGWIVALRREQIETVRWGGRPEKKTVGVGPLGARLTPRGSFAEWRETVRDSAVPFEDVEREIAAELRVELMRASAARAGEFERARTLLLAELGHDLRDPLQSISMAARVIELGRGDERLGQRIRTSSGRMARLVSQVLDFSRLNAGIGLALQPRAVDLVSLLRDLLEESALAHPGVRVEPRLPAALPANVDPDRFTQMVSNLLSNARHHGVLDQPIGVTLQTDASGGLWIDVDNVAEPIPEDLQAVLFNPLKRGQAAGAGGERNRSGLGLGLYIASEIAKAHGGRIDYRHEGGRVVFRIGLPAPITPKP